MVCIAINGVNIRSANRQPANILYIVNNFFIRCIKCEVLLDLLI